MRRALRVPIRLAAAATATGLVWLTLRVSLWLAPGRRARRAVRHFFFRFWSLALCRLFAVRITVVGDPPSAPCLLVTNHLSYVDVLVLASLLPARFVAKSELSGWPVIGAMCRTVDTLFIDRASRRDAAKVGRDMGQALSDGDAIVLFPEATSTHGHSLISFRPTLLAPAASARLPVHFGALHYSTMPADPPAHLSVCWWGDMPFGPHAIDFLKLSRVEARVSFGPEPIVAEDRKALADRLEQEVGKLFEPIVDHEPTWP